MEEVAMRVTSALMVLMSMGLLVYVFHKVQQMERRYEELRESYRSSLAEIASRSEPTSPKPVDEVK